MADSNSVDKNRELFSASLLNLEVKWLIYTLRSIFEICKIDVYCLGNFSNENFRVSKKHTTNHQPIMHANIIINKIKPT